jgi:hypothetical protein
MPRVKRKVEVPFPALDKPFLTCRMQRAHALDDVTGIDTLPGAQNPITRYLRGSRLLFRCLRCGTYREDVISRVTGDVMARRYVHPKGYEIEGTYTVQQFRLHYLDIYYPER